MNLSHWRAAKAAQRADPDAMTQEEQELFDWLLEAELRGRLPRDNKTPIKGP